jgi:hypothetical protein
MTRPEGEAEVAPSTTGATVSQARCLSCPQEVQDRAVLCRFCKRRLPTHVDYIDEREGHFALGTTDAGLFAVWDLAQGGPPLRTFTDDEQGWEKAWAVVDALGGSTVSAATRSLSWLAYALPLLGFAAVFLIGVAVSSHAEHVPAAPPQVQVSAPLASEPQQVQSFVPSDSQVCAKIREVLRSACGHVRHV